ncbi:P6 protein [Tomato yellow mottle-associated virus]|uniref:p6 protein n=1 Tax=Tomato yellow mottle-associated virus TaxID=1967841 RepID=A0A1U9W1C5_9RHAB|nr:P6 protein [Tomato yellow mottle-associated virus]AQY17506.1 P6 protein [Tomato yellow mottle-associated virus]
MTEKVGESQSNRLEIEGVLTYKTNQRYRFGVDVCDIHKINIKPNYIFSNLLLYVGQVSIFPRAAAMPSIKDMVATIAGATLDPNQDDTTINFPEMTDEIYQYVIFTILVIKFVLLIIVYRLKRKNQVLTASLKWK